MSSDFNVHISGPVFDGTAARAMREGQLAVRHKLADKGEEKVRARFNAQIIRNTGVFISSITQTDWPRVYAWSGTWGKHGRKITRTYTMPIIVEDLAVETIVTSGNAMYGPWLEGTGSRNATSRFKGYHGFRLAAGDLDGEAESIADEALQPFIERCR